MSVNESRILATVNENYTRCTTYEDSGTLDVVAIRGDLTWRMTASFSTVYIRPSVMKFNFSSQSDGGLKSNLLLVANGDSIRCQSTSEGDKDPERVRVYSSLSDAVSALQGTTAGSILFISVLLDDSLSAFNNWKAVSRLPDEVLGEDMCHQISGETDDGNMTVWISKSTYAIRRVKSGYPDVEKQRLAHEFANQVYAAEGMPIEEFVPIDGYTIFNYPDVTFNNSITIDAVS